MKTSVKIIIGAGLFILLAGTIGICVHHHYSHRGMRGMREAAFYHRQGMDERHMWRGGREAGMPMMRGMRPGMGRGPMNGMRRGMGPGQMNGMGRGMGTMPGDSMWRANMGFGRMMGNIPDLTDKQKKEILDLRQQQQDEMKKLRAEVATKMQDLREAHRKKVMELLTPEQKKFVESHTGIADPAK
jgi:hypothetical protein